MTDKSGIKNNEYYTYGWAEKGKRLFADKPRLKRKRVSIIGAVNKGKGIINNRLVSILKLG